MPNEWRADVPPLGSSTVSIAGLGDARESAGSPNPVLSVRGGIVLGRLSVDAALAARIVDAALGGIGLGPAVRALGPAERGVLAGALGGLFDGVGWSVGLAPPAGEDFDLAAIVMRIETKVGGGTLELQLSASSLGAGGGMFRAGGALARRLSRIPLAAEVRIASTQLRAVDVAAVGPGDAVVFDGVPAERFAASARWPAKLTIGDAASGSWPIHVDSEGIAMVAGKREAQTEEEQMSGSGNTEDADMTAALAAVPVEVVAELGRVTLRGEELAGLAPGAVFTVGAGRGNVSLWVGGERWADGEIVDVDGELGVRVTRVRGR
jgi:flagellar motor switch/type III secretory pathway protein FliN